MKLAVFIFPMSSQLLVLKPFVVIYLKMSILMTYMHALKHYL